MEKLRTICLNTALFAKEAREIFGLSKSIPTNKALFDIAILTASNDEFDSIKSLLEECHEIEGPNNDSTIYYAGLIQAPKKIYKVVLPFPQSMGIEAAVCITTKIINHYNPAFLVMTGVCAGNKNITNIGDIVIAEKSVNYNNVVEIDKTGKDSRKKFMQNADSINKNLKSRLSLYSRSKHINEIHDNYTEKEKFPKELKCHIGLVVTGSSLVRSAPKIKEINEDYHGVIAMDMETHGFYYTSSNSVNLSTPNFVSIKGVSDFGDDTVHKVSAFDRKKYALYTSSNAVIEFIKNEMK